MGAYNIEMRCFHELTAVIGVFLLLYPLIICVSNRKGQGGGIGFQAK